MIMQSYFLRLVDEYYRAEIGQICVQWSFLDTTLEACIWQAAGMRNDIGWTITSQIQLQAKLDLLAGLLHQSYPDFAGPFDQVVRYIRECLVGERNLVVHGFWLQLPRKEPEVAKFSAKGRLKYQGKAIIITDLQTLSQNIADVADWLMTLSARLPPLRQRPGGLGDKTPDTPNPQNCANLKTRVLQPLPSPE